MPKTTRRRGADTWVGFDLGGTKMLACVYDKDFRQIGSARTKTHGKEGPRHGMARMVATIQEALRLARRTPASLAGIGVGCPGPIDFDKGVLLATPNLPWKNLPLRKILEKRFGCPTTVLNDVDAGVYGEYRFGAGRHARCVVGVFPGTGIGGGCVYEGRILRGRNASAFEIGHCIVQPDGPLCGCGNRGCLEAVAGRVAVVSAAAAAAQRGEARHLLARKGLDISKIRSRALAVAIRRGDESIERIVRHAARWLGRGVALSVNLVVPDIVVLGGGLVEAMPEIFLKETTASARNHAMPAFRDAFEVSLAQLGDNAVVMGAAAWAQETVTAGAKD
jgi:glucokinase